MFGWIMPAPLAMPVTVTVAPSIVDLARRRLGHRVGGHDRARPRRTSRRRAAAHRAAGSAGHDAVDRQRLHDHAGRERQHLLGRAAEELRRPRRRSRARRRARLTGAGIRVAGIDHQRAESGACRALLRQMLATDDAPAPRRSGSA